VGYFLSLPHTSNEIWTLVQLDIQSQHEINRNTDSFIWWIHNLLWDK